MNKILLALILLGTGGGAFLTARQSTIRLQSEASATRGVWLSQTQLLAAARSEQASLIERIRDSKQALAQLPAVTENALWSAVQTNRAGRLSPELREPLLEELGFNWRSSEDFIVVSKETLREIKMQSIRDGRLTDLASTVLTITPAERGQVAAVMQRVQMDFNDWTLAHTERKEPQGDVVAQYTLANDPAMTVSNRFAEGMVRALGSQRAELILRSAEEWLWGIGIRQEPLTMILKRFLVGNEPRLKFQTFKSFGTPQQGGDANPLDLSARPFPSAFLPVFPNGWEDVAKREGFELPEESQKK